jgi:hypothetical protein
MNLLVPASAGDPDSLVLGIDAGSREGATDLWELLDPGEKSVVPSAVGSDNQVRWILPP